VNQGHLISYFYFLNQAELQLAQQSGKLQHLMIKDLMAPMYQKQKNIYFSTRYTRDYSDVLARIRLRQERISKGLTQ